jgi:hypothetical protein
MGAREVYQAACKAAEVARLATVQSATLTHQITVDNAGINVGNHPSRGVADGSTLDLQTRAANASLAATRMLAEMTKQVAIQNARDVLRNSGDLGPA